MESEYTLLKDNIAKIIKCGSSMEYVKFQFEKIIDSKRTFDRIKTAKKLFEVLEDRDELSEDNIVSLTFIGNILKVEEIGNLIKAYKKLQDLSDIPKCSICRNEYMPFQERKPDCVPVEPCNTTILKTISENIGPKWRILIRELNVLNERQIDDIKRKFKNNSSLQAFEALKLWKEIEGQNATLMRLEAALNARLCKYEGLGSHVLKPIIKIQC